MTLPQVTVVVDLDSAITPNLRRWNNPGRGVLVGMVRSSARQTGWLASDLLTALGKTSGRGFSADGWAVAAAHLVPWLVVDEIEHIVIGYAEVLPSNQLVAITHLAALAEVDVWFVADAGTTDTLATFAEEFGATVLDAEDFGPHMLTASRSADAQRPCADADNFPSAVPEDTFLTFLATARRTMNESSFAQVLDLFIESFDDTVAWLDGLGNAPTELDVAEHVSAIVVGRATLASVTTAMRGIQAAAFRRGLLIKLDARRFLNRMSETRTAIDLRDEEWGRLSANGNTRQCAIAVLAALGMTVAAIHELTADRVASDASSIRTEEHTYQVPTAARPLLLAQLLYRASAGDPSNPLLLAGSRKDATFTLRGASLAIDDLARSTGIAFRAAHDRWDSESMHWRQRAGIFVAELAA
jgi:hypothetical protein